MPPVFLGHDHNGAFSLGENVMADRPWHHRSGRSGGQYDKLGMGLTGGSDDDAARQSRGDPHVNLPSLVTKLILERGPQT